MDSRALASTSAPDALRKADFLWSLYLSERDFIKHHEVQRITASNILAAIAAGLMVSVGTGQITSEVQWMISLLLMMIGLFGFLFCGKLYALIQLHAERSYEYLEALDKVVPDIDIAAHKAAVGVRHARRFKFFRKLALHQVWAMFHMLIFLSGIVFLLRATYGDLPSLWQAARSVLEGFGA